MESPQRAMTAEPRRRGVLERWNWKQARAATKAVKLVATMEVGIGGMVIILGDIGDNGDNTPVATRVGGFQHWLISAMIDD